MSVQLFLPGRLCYWYRLGGISRNHVQLYTPLCSVEPARYVGNQGRATNPSHRVTTFARGVIRSVRSFWLQFQRFWRKQCRAPRFFGLRHADGPYPYGHRCSTVRRLEARDGLPLHAVVEDVGVQRLRGYGMSPCGLMLLLVLVVEAEQVLHRGIEHAGYVHR